MNATVTMPVKELDDLRDKIKELEVIKKDLESHQKEVKLTIKKKEMGFGVREGYNQWALHRYIEHKEMDIIQPPVYINFEEVKETLKEEVKSEFVQKIGDLERRNIDLQKQKEELKTSEKKKFEDYKSADEKILAKKEEEYKKQIENLENQIKILNGELVDLGKDEEIKQLKAAIDKLNSRNFIQRIFNI